MSDRIDFNTKEGCHDHLELPTDNIKSGSISIINNNLYKVDIDKYDYSTMSSIDYALYYKKPTETLLNNESSRFRPIYESETYNYLKNKYWLNFGIKYLSKCDDYIEDNDSTTFTIREKITSIDNGTNNYQLNIVKLNSETSIDVNKTKKYSLGYPCYEDISNDENLIKTKYKELFDRQNEINEIHIFKTPGNDIDIVNSGLTADIINYTTDVYTNSLNLNNFVMHSSQDNVYGEIKVDIQYTKNNNLYSASTMFEAFRYLNNEVIRTNFIQDVNQEVLIEYINGILKVSPKIKEIDECIISNCTLTYGKE